jgi:hypothetical protein
MGGKMTKRDRERAFMGSAKLGLTERDARRLLRVGATLHRLAEATCSGYWPADNGTGNTWKCPKCEQLWRVKHCPDCKAEQRARDILSSYPDLAHETQGDPRGAILKVWRRNDPRGWVMFG